MMLPRAADGRAAQRVRLARLASLGLCLALLFSLYQVAVHSVHHVGDAAHVSECVVAAAASHFAAAAPTVLVPRTPVAVARWTPPRPVLLAPPPLVVGPRADRAPPPRLVA